MAMPAPEPRTFKNLKPVNRGYSVPASAKVDLDLYERLSRSGWANPVKRYTVPRRGATAWELRAGQTCRIIVAYGPQVGDLNLWNLHNPKQERFYSGKTRQLQRSHLSVGDRLWSNMPHLRPMATVSQDSLSGYGIDADGCSVHDVIGTRCDPYTYKLINGVPSKNSCHQALTKAIEPYGLDEYDVHDVFNIFMCSGFDRKTHEYLIRGSPVEKGDYIELVAEMDLLLALCACPQGDVSSSASDSDDVTCFPLDVCVGQPDDALIAEWREAQEN